jgi:hypothetical protein
MIVNIYDLETVINFTRKDIVIGEDIKLLSRRSIDLKFIRVTTKAAVAGIEELASECIASSFVDHASRSVPTYQVEFYYCDAFWVKSADWSNPQVLVVTRIARGPQLDIATNRSSMGLSTKYKSRHNYQNVK